MAIEATLLIVKPDGVRRGLVGEVLRRVEAKGLRIEAMRLATIDRATAEAHYGEHVDKPFFGELVDFITSGPVVLARISGEQAITAWRALMGPTDPVQAPPGSIRGDLATLIGENLVHGSDAPASAERELALFFPRGVAGGMPGLAEAFERIGTSVEHHLPVSHAGGLALAVTDREEILGVVVRGFADVASGAPVRPETRFQIGSISKSFASIVLLQEVEAGRVDLHVSVNDLVPWLELPEPFGPITLHHLLQHTSGLATGTEDAPTGPGALWRLRDLPPTFPPGERFWYSNDGYKIVGAVLEHVTRTPIHELLRERILDPLGMMATEAAITDAVRTEQATGYAPIFTDRPPQLHHPLAPATWIQSNTADGSIVSNVLDMSSYARMLLAEGGDDVSGRRIVSEASFELLSSGGRDFGDGERYAYGLWEVEVDGHRWVAHTGGMVGFTAVLATSPEEGLACVALQNGHGSMWQLVGRALASVRAALAGDALPEPFVPPSPSAIPGAERYAGTYVTTEGRALEVSVEGEGLAIRVDGNPVAAQRDPLERDPIDAFALPHPDLEGSMLRFGRDAGGAMVEAFHGNDWFRAERYAGPEPEEPPAGWAGRVGLYRSNDPWTPTIRTSLRKGRLAIAFPVEAGDEEGEAELVPLDDGWFAVGEPWHPRRVRFEGEIEGRAVAVVFNGGTWYRSFEV